jgi:NAD(P)-dependent dehydrogenase (short-subunit alcohol dehydrogenase family)
MALLDGRTAIVTGGGRGIGAATARALDAAGARVAIVSRSGDQLVEVAGTLVNEPIAIVADLGTPEGPSAAAAEALNAFDGRLDILVNNAAALLRKDTEAVTVDDIDQVLAVNVRGPLLLIQAIIPAMLAAGRGSIVSISSVSALRGTPRRQVYAASKAALDGMTRSLAMEYGPRGIRANTIAPGVVATEMWIENLAKPGVADSVIGLTPVRRLTTTDEIASVVVFLASDAASAITGEVIPVDGGINSTVNLWPTV